MDADALRMLADLGLERRDLVSAPDDIPSSRRIREDPREQAAIAKAFEKRRTDSSKDANGTDERAARLKAWNTETTFETDEVTGLLANRWSGQGHRAGLERQRRDRGESWEEFDARFGEERRMYIQVKGGQPKNYENMRPSRRRGPETFRDLLSDDVKTPDRPRAADPRTFGTVKFKPGSTRAVPNAGIQAAAALRRHAANNPGLAVRDRNVPDDPNAASLRAKWSNVDAASKTNSVSNAPPSATSAATSLREKWSNVGAAPKSTPVHSVVTPEIVPAKPSISSKAPTMPAPVVEDWVYTQGCRNRALYYAASPGKECDEYHEKYPDRKHYLEEARKELIKEAIALVKEGDEKEIAAVLKMHSGRNWMIENARKAKKLVEDGFGDAADAGFTGESNMAPFIDAAKTIFTPQKSSTPMAAPQSSSEESTDSTGNGGSSSDTEGSIQTAASTPPPPKSGSLIATFFSAAGSLLGSHHTRVSAPVQATMSFSSRVSHYDPRQLIQAIDTLAQSMMDRTKGLEGVKLADDGLWIDDEL